MNRRSSSGKGSFNQTLAPLLFLSPNLIVFAVFIILPTLDGLRLSLFQWSIFDGNTFIGLKNFADLIKDTAFWGSFLNTLRYVIAVVPLTVFASLGLAFLTVNQKYCSSLVRGIFYMPCMLSFIIVGIAWRWLLGYDLGIVNYVLSIIGLEPVKWLSTPYMANISLVFITVWSITGFYMVMFIAALQAIPEDLFSAALIDGANRMQVFSRIELPLLNPTMLVVSVLATINSFKAFELIYTLTRGGPGSATKFLVQNIYQVAFEEDRLGYASAMAMMLMVTIGLLTLIQFRARRKGYEQE